MQPIDYVYLGFLVFMVILLGGLFMYLGYMVKQSGYSRDVESKKMSSIEIRDAFWHPLSIYTFFVL